RNVTGVQTCALPISQKLRQMIEKGILARDQQLPSVRSLAMELSINPNTIQRAYALLEKEGYIYPVKGKGNFVSPKENFMEERKRSEERRVGKDWRYM